MAIFHTLGASTSLCRSSSLLRRPAFLLLCGGMGSCAQSISQKGHDFSAFS